MSNNIHIVVTEDLAKYIKTRSKQHSLTMSAFIKMVMYQYMQQDKDYLESNK